jgi:hypothetical protein
MEDITSLFVYFHKYFESSEIAIAHNNDEKLFFLDDGFMPVFETSSKTKQ